MDIETRKIFVGTRVNCALWNAGPGTVSAIYGKQQPNTVRTFGGGCVVSGGSVTLDIVFDNGTMSLALPEAVVRSMQWQIFGEVFDAEAIAVALTNAAVVKAEKIRKEQEDASVHTNELERLKECADFAHLTQGTDRFSGKLAAVNIRKELKAAFPAIKFSVRVRNYGSVSILWTDGPLIDEVDNVVCRHQGGSFNGMEDIYENRQSAWCEVFGGADYVNTSREISEQLIDRAITALFEKYSGNLIEIDRPSAADMKSGRLWSVQVPGLFDNLQRLIYQQVRLVRG